MKQSLSLLFVILVSLLVVSCERATLVEAGTDRTLRSVMNAPFDPGRINNIKDLVDRVESPSYSVVAGFGADTRTSLSMNSEQTSAAVLWNKGDMYETLSLSDWMNDNMYYAQFTAREGGKSSVPFRKSQGTCTGPSYCFYPEFTGLSAYPMYDDNDQFLDILWLFGMTLPHEQTAVQGGVESGLLLSYAYIENEKASPLFQNIPALIRFRLSGSLVKSVKQVKLSGGGTLTGDFIFVDDFQGNPVIIPGYNFEGDLTYNTAVLDGSFTAGKDYYFAVLPGTFPNMTLTVSDGEGHYSTKIASGEITCRQGRITDLGTIKIGTAFTDEDITDPATLYMQATKGSKPVSLAIIPEGFQKNEMAQYESLARSAMDAMFNTEPFKTYKDYFNVWILKTASQDSGASVTDEEGNIVTYRNTRFGSSWGEEEYDNMFAETGEVFSYVYENCPDVANGVHTLAEVPILMIINDTRYGGICVTTEGGEGFAMCPFIKGGASLSWSFPEYEASSNEVPAGGYRKVSQTEMIADGLVNTGDWRNAVIHEFGGHCFGRLLDEYWYDGYLPAVDEIEDHSLKVPYGLNISAAYDNTPWQADLLSRKEALVAKDPHYERMGSYQGGDNSIYNRWRSERISCMIDNRFYFSAWQRELLVKRIMTLAGETFNLDDFLAKDVTYDPVRDGSSPKPKAVASLPVKFYPPFARPVMIDVKR